jgi:type IV secretory pathway VirB4 component
MKFLKKRLSNLMVRNKPEPLLKDKPLSYAEDGDISSFHFPSVLDVVMNDGLSFEKDHFMIQTGLGKVRYGRAFFVKPSGYPRTVPIGWIEELYRYDDVDVSVHVEPIGRNDSLKKIQKQIDKLETVMIGAEKRANSSLVRDTQTKLREASKLQEEIRMNVNGLFYVSVLATLYADSLEDLNLLSVQLEDRVGGNSIHLLNAFYRQKEGFLSVLPLGKNHLLDTQRNLDRRALAAIFPHGSSRLSHEGGIPIGRNQMDGEFIYFNNFDMSLDNYNFSIFGRSGSGKSYFSKSIVGRGLMDGIKTWIVDVEPEYVALTKALGGIVIPIRMDSDIRINPLDLFPTEEVVRIGGQQETVIQKVNVQDKIAEMIQFFRVMVESSDAAGSGLNPIELGVLVETLKSLYEKREITSDPNSLYEFKEAEMIDGTIKWGKRMKEMPTISEVLAAVSTFRPNYGGQLERLIQVIRLFTKQGSFSLFDGQTYLGEGVEFNLESSPVVTFDISKLSKSSLETPLAMIAIIHWIWSRFVIRYPKQKKRTLIDEAWMLLEYQSMVDFLEILSLRGRKRNHSLTIVSQKYDRFAQHPRANAIISQSGTIAFLRQSETDIDAILQTFKFSNHVGELIMTADKGDTIMRSGNEIVAFFTQAAPSEEPYLNTNQNLENEHVEAMANKK